jgi:hypothetical protein
MMRIYYILYTIYYTFLLYIYSTSIFQAFQTFAFF